jgi:vancomycin permeability regulator SanA
MLLAVILTLSVIPLSLLLYIIQDGLRDTIFEADAGVVLGTTVYPSGEPSPRLKARLDKGFELYTRGKIKNVIVSGGLGREGHNEALVMRQYLIDKGIPAHHIIADEHGLDTYSTTRKTAQLMNQKDWTGLIVISQFFHITRAKYACRRFGISPLGSGHADIYRVMDCFSLLREWLALGYYAVRNYPTPHPLSRIQNGQ